MTAARFRLTPPVPAETELHGAVADMLRLVIMPPAEWTTFPAGHVQLSGAAAAKLHRLGLRRNWPDILLIHGGAVFGLELKKAGGRLAPTRTLRTRRGRLRTVEGQAEGFAKLRRAGMMIEVCDSLDAVMATLRAWNLPLRGVRPS